MCTPDGRCDTTEIADHPLCGRFAFTGNNAHILLRIRKQEIMRDNRADILFPNANQTKNPDLIVEFFR